MNYLDKLEEGRGTKPSRRTIPRSQQGGFQPKTTSSDRRVAPTEKSLAGHGLSRAQYRERMMQAHTSYQQIGDILAEAMLGKIRFKVAGALKKFARKQYRKGEVDDASGKPTRAKIRGKAAHVAGKLAQKVEPKEEG